MIGASILLTAGCSPLGLVSRPSPAPPSVVSTRPVIGFVSVPITDLTQAEADRLNNAWMTGEFQCDARGAFSDITAGSEVQLTDTRGNVVATTTLDDGSIDASVGTAESNQGRCSSRFSFTSVTIDQALYRVHVGDADRQSFGFTEGAIRRGPIITIE